MRTEGAALNTTKPADGQPPKTPAAPSGSLNSLDRIVAVLDALRVHPSATLAEVARMTQLSEPTAYRYLTALRGHRMVTRDPRGTYTLGLKLFELGSSALSGIDPRVVARPHLIDLRDAFGETCSMATHADGELVIIAAEQATHGVAKGATVGDRDEWHSTALGKAILADLPEPEARAILEKKVLARFTHRTLTDLDQLLTELRRVREEGYAVDDEESEVHLRCVGAAVHDAAGTPRFAISVSGPTFRVTPERVPEIAERLTATARALSADLGWQPGA